jgi:Phage capsid family
MPTLERLGDLTTDTIRQQYSLEFVRWLACYQEHADPATASRRYLERWPRSLVHDIIKKSLTIYETKAAVAPGTTTDATWAGALVGGVRELADAFIALARSASLLGRIPGLRRVPFRANVPVQTQGGSFYWVAQNTPKPITALAFDAGVTLGPTKASGVVVVTEELARLSVPGTEGALRDTLIAGLTQFTDEQFLDPTVAAVAGKNPASITHGTTPIAGTGDLAADVGALLEAFFLARPAAIGAVLVMAPGAAAALIGTTGQAGTAFGVPIVPTAAAGARVIVLDPAGVLVADAGLELDVSREAAVQMVDAPDTPPTAATVHMSFWQHNLAGFRVERLVNWEALPDAVLYLEPAAAATATASRRSKAS